MADIDDIAASLNTLLTTYGVTRDQMADLLGGAADGGPNGDGTFPVTLANGATVLVPSPKRIALLSGDPSQAVAVITPLLNAAKAAAAQAADALAQAVAARGDALAASASAAASAGSAIAPAMDIIAADFGMIQLCDAGKIAPGYQANGDSGGFNGDDSWFHTGMMRCKPGGQAIVGVDKGDGNGTVPFQVGQGGYGIMLYDAAGSKTGVVDGPIAAGQPINFPAGSGVQFVVQGPTTYNSFAVNGWRLTVVSGNTLPSTYLEYGLTTRAKTMAAVRSSMLPLYVDRTQNVAKSQNVTQNVYIVAGDKGFTGNTDWVSVRMPVTPGGTVTLSYKTFQGYYWEDELGAKIAAPALPKPTDVSPVGGYQLAVPTKAVVLVYSLQRQNYLAGFQAVDGAVTLGSVLATTPAAVGDARPWLGKSWAGQGTSIDANQPWLAAVGAYHGVASILNWARGGTDSRHNMFDGNAVAIVQADATGLDMIYLSQFTNDLANGVAIGSIADALTDFTANVSGTTLTVTSVQAGPAFAVGQSVWFPGVMSDANNLPTITALGSGTGGTGTYTLSKAQSTIGGVGAVSMPTTVWALTRNFVRQMTIWSPHVVIVLETPIQRFEGANISTAFAGMVAMRDQVFAMALAFSCPVNDLLLNSGANEYTYKAGAAAGYTGDGVHPAWPAGYQALKIQPTIGRMQQVRPRSAPLRVAA